MNQTLQFTVPCFLLKHIMRSKWQLEYFSFILNGNMRLLPVFKKVITGILRFLSKHTISAELN